MSWPVRSTGPARPARSVRSTVLLPVVAVLAAVLVPGGPTATAAATSCVGDDHAPMELAEAGEIGLAAAEQYDGVVLGTVVSVSGRPQGPVDVAVDLTGTFGPLLPRRVEIVSPDEGVLNGYAFQRGQHYLIPYRLQGSRMHSFVCDPIFVVSRAEVPGLVAGADRGAWPRPAGHPESSLGVLVDQAAASSDPVGGWPVVLGGLALGVAALAVILRWLRRSGTAMSDSRQSATAQGSRLEP